VTSFIAYRDKEKVVGDNIAFFVRRFSVCTPLCTVYSMYGVYDGICWHRQVLLKVLISYLP
jgi:hypothetical protein